MRLTRRQRESIIRCADCMGDSKTGWEDRNMDACISTAEDSSTYGKHLMKFGPVTPEFCWRFCTQDELNIAICDA